MTNSPTILTIPCLSGAPWELEQLSPLADLDLRTLALPDEPATIEAYADLVQAAMRDLTDVVLVGDSFGAVVALSVALRRPGNLLGLVLSGGVRGRPCDRAVDPRKGPRRPVPAGPAVSAVRAAAARRRVGITPRRRR